ncbi:MAG TPA: lytic transglycosylase domain-containing protein [Longimicrobiales bacterium]
MNQSNSVQRSDGAPQRGGRSRRLIVSLCVATVMFVLGAAAARDPGADLATLSLEQELRAAKRALTARQGELELARLELHRLSNIVEHSKTYRIPADLATAIYDIALSEGVDPTLAFSLVRVESGFTRRAVSSAGAVGLTQVMPKTAFWLQPGLAREDLFERDTNLRLGFRYLRMMLEQYDGDLHLALLAYNRGPGRVDDILRAGGDPSNGYSFSVRAGLTAATANTLRLRGG